MLRPRWHKVLADLWENKVRTLLVVASIAIGVFSIGTIAGAYVMIPQGMNVSYADSLPANIEMTTETFDDDFVERIRHLEGVAQAEGRRVFEVRAQTRTGEWISLDVIALNFDDIRLKLLTPQTGKAAPEDREIILIDGTLDSLGLQTGDTLRIQLPDGAFKDLKIAGSTKDLTAGIESIVNSNVGYVTINSLEWLHQPTGYNLLLVSLQEGGNDKASVHAMSVRVRTQLEHSGRQVYITRHALTNQHPLGYIIEAVLGILGFLGILILFLSSSLIANTLNSLVNQQMRQIGVMKLVGARRNAIIGMYLTLIFAFGLLAFAIALLPSSAAAYRLAVLPSELLNIIIPINTPFPLLPPVIALQIFVALVIPTLAGLLPVILGSRITVLEAINSGGIDLSDSTPEGGRISRWMAARGIAGGPVTIALRNTFRRRGRLALTLFTLSLGGAIFISVFNVQVSLDRKVHEITQYFAADVNLDFDRTYRIEEVAQLARQFPEITHVEGWGAVGAELLDNTGEVTDNVTILAPPAASPLVEPILLQGRWVQPGDKNALAVNEAFWNDYPTLKAGDYLHLRINGREHIWQIVGIFQYAGLNQLFAYTNYEILAPVMGITNRAAVFRFVSTDHNLQAQKDLSIRMDDFFRARGYQVQQVESGGSFTATITELLGVLIIVLLVMALLTATVGSIGLAGTLSMNVLERTREIGVLRAVGAGDRVIIQLVIIEGLTIGLLSYAIATVLSFPITALLADIISRAIFNSPANFAFTFSGFIIWLLIVLGMSALASVLPARSAARMTIREVLAYE